MVRIEGLPSELAEVPGLVPGDAYWALGGDDWRQDWQRWRREVLQYRHTVMEGCDSTQDSGKRLRWAVAENCARSTAYFAAMVGWMYEPRPERPLAGPQPFLPFAAQVGLWDWIEARHRARGAAKDGLVSKARDMGGTWCFCADFVRRFLFDPIFSALLMSQKEEKVDKQNDRRTLFYKIDYLIKNLPAWLQPAWAPAGTYDPLAHRNKLALMHPTKENFIAGQSTTTVSGRGDRAGDGLIDEACAVDDLRLVASSLIGTVAHLFILSSENVERGDDFQQMQQAYHQGDPYAMPVVGLDWWLHPEFDEAWHEEERQRYASKDDLDGFEREVNRNPWAGFGELVYHFTEEPSVGDFPFEPGMPIWVGLDPGRDDETALQVLCYDPRTKRYRLVRTYCNASEAPEFYASICAGVADEPFTYQPYGIFDTQDTLDWFAGLAVTPIFCGDPYGGNTYTKKGDSWYDAFERHYRKLKGKGVRVQKSWEMEARTYVGRRTALRALLRGGFDFDRHDSVAHTLAAFHNYRFERRDKARMTEQAAPKHNWASHPISALEYLAVYLYRRNPMLKRAYQSYLGEQGTRGRPAQDEEAAA